MIANNSKQYHKYLENELSNYKMEEARNKKEINVLRSKTNLLERELTDKESKINLLKRRTSSFQTSRTDSNSSINTNLRKMPKQKSSQNICSEPISSVEEIEFTIIELESQTVGINCSISYLKQKYNNINITHDKRKEFVAEFMKVWRDFNSLEEKFLTLFTNQLPVEHEYKNKHKHNTQWLSVLRQSLLELRKGVIDRHINTVENEKKCEINAILEDSYLPKKQILCRRKNIKLETLATTQIPVKSKREAISSPTYSEISSNESSISGFSTSSTFSSGSSSSISSNPTKQIRFHYN